MKRIMTIATGTAFAIFLSFTMAMLNVSLAEAQEGPLTGLMAAGVYVEDVEQEPGVQGRVIILYADGNLTLYDPTAIAPLYGTWEQAGGTSTDTDTATDTDTTTDTSTDTGTDTGPVTLDATLYDPNTGETTSYTIEIDATFTSLTLTNGDPEATFTRIGTDTTPTDTDTTPTDTDTTPTDTDTTPTDTDTTPTDTDTTPTDTDTTPTDTDTTPTDTDTDTTSPDTDTGTETSTSTSTATQ
jgi:hypothetical protein